MSYIIFGSTKHSRFHPIKHQFKYPLYMIEIDTKKLNTLNKISVLMGYNSKKLLSVFDSDYLGTEPRSISEKISLLMMQSSSFKDIDTIKLITTPRLIFKPFKPVSFYLGYSKDKALKIMIAEVSNTYHETHYYLLEHPSQSKKGVRFLIDKHFHVSPFFNEEGYYSFDVKNTDQQLSIQMNYVVNHKKVFYADFIGKKKNLTTYRVIETCLRFPFTSLLILPRILWEAGKLHFTKGLTARSKPIPTHEHALRPMPLSNFQKRIIKRIEVACSDLTYGTLSLILPDSSSHCFGSATTGPQATMLISNNWFFRSIRLGGEIGLGESYVRGEWDSPKLREVIEFMILNKHALHSKFKGSLFVSMLNKLKHRCRKNTVKKSKENISEHYDLGNPFYRLFLDPTMMYSSALFKNKDDTLKQAQMQKVDRLIESLELNQNSHVLDIGSGWGYTSCRIAERYGCQVTTITLSKEQKNYVKSVLKKRGLADKITVLIQDYRNITGKFDAIVSIEMIEAVGHSYLPLFLKICDQHLKKGGKLSLQAITYPKQDYHNYRKRTDFIRKHIFPGGHLPSLERLDSIIKDKTNLRKVDALNIAQSYAKTLFLWRQAFIKKKNDLLNMGFNTSFYRKWIYYFSYCEAAFKTDYLGCYQLLYEKKHRC